MSQPLFGTGLLTLTPNLAAPVTPTVVAVLQDISLDASFKIVDLLGNLQFPVDKAKAEGKLSGKFKTGYFAGGLINAILSGSTSAASIAGEASTTSTPGREARSTRVKLT